MPGRSVTGQLWGFLKVTKKWWLLPILAALLGVGAVLVITEGSILAPFIYSIF